MWWPDISWLYLKAFIDEGVQVRALPIGGAPLVIPPGDTQWRHWTKVAHLFSTKLADDWNVNIVCAPPGYPLGQVRRRGDLSPRNIPELSDMEPADFSGADPDQIQASMTEIAKDSDPKEVVYQPSTALSSLWASGGGRLNIAVTDVLPKEPDDQELWHLDHRYDEVVAPTEGGAALLRRTGAIAQSVLCVRPDQLPNRLRDMRWI